MTADADVRGTLSEIPPLGKCGGGDSDDLGKVIGKQGRTVRAMRTLVEAGGEKNGQRFYLDIIE